MSKRSSSVDNKGILKKINKKDNIYTLFQTRDMNYLMAQSLQDTMTEKFQLQQSSFAMKRSQEKKIKNAGKQYKITITRYSEPVKEVLKKAKKFDHLNIPFPAIRDVNYFIAETLQEKKNQVYKIRQPKRRSQTIVKRQAAKDKEAEKLYNNIFFSKYN